MAKLQKIAVVLPSKKGPSDEKAFAKVLDALVKVQDGILDVLTDIEKTKPMPKELASDVSKRRTIQAGRTAELKDMEKSRKRGELHTNPSKLERLYKDLNEDVAQTNWLEGGVDKALDKHYEATDVAQMLTELKAEIPDTFGAIGVKTLLVPFMAKNQKERWASFAKNKVAFFDEAKGLARVEGIKKLKDHDDYKVLQQGRRESIINAAVKDDKKTVDQVKKELADKLVWQDKPDKSRWASALKLGAGGSYRIVKSGDFDGHPIHWTMSNDSWTNAADKGVSIKALSEEKMLEALLKSQDFKQLHATLEIGDSKQYPHVFLFAGAGNAAKWQTAAATHKATLKDSSKFKEATWIANGQKALQAVLDDVKKDLLAKLKAIKTTGGANM